MSAHDRIINGDLITTRFGEWPSFHDAEVISVLLGGHRPEKPFCETLIHSWITTDQVDAGAYYVREKHTLVTFSFEDLITSELMDFNSQNCLLELSIKEELMGGEIVLRVDFPTSFGLEGTIKCRRIVVKSVEPCDANGRTLQP